jgi:signal transduction histidine kinase
MTTQEVPMLARFRPPPAVLAASALTLVGVPAGLALTGGATQGVMAVSLGFWLAVFALFLGRFPVTVLVLSVLSVAALRSAELISSGWAWPATAAFVAVVLAGKMRTAVVVGALTLLFGANWDGFVDLDLTLNQTLTRIGGETLWLAAVLAAAQAYRNTRRWQSEVAARLAQDEHERELDARRRRAEERVDIARDLHDVVSHTLAVVGVHLNVALDAFDTSRRRRARRCGSRRTSAAGR